MSSVSRISRETTAGKEYAPCEKRQWKLFSRAGPEGLAYVVRACICSLGWVVRVATEMLQLWPHAALTSTGKVSGSIVKPPSGDE